MENFDRKNIDDLMEIRQFVNIFPVKILRRTVYLENDMLVLLSSATSVLFMTTSLIFTKTLWLTTQGINI